MGKLIRDDLLACKCYYIMPCGIHTECIIYDFAIAYRSYVCTH